MNDDPNEGEEGEGEGEEGEEGDDAGGGPPAGGLAAAILDGGVGEEGRGQGRHPSLLEAVRTLHAAATGTARTIEALGRRADAAEAEAARERRARAAAEAALAQAERDNALLQEALAVMVRR